MTQTGSSWKQCISYSRCPG